MAKKKQKLEKISNIEPELSAPNTSLQPLRKPFIIVCLIIIILLLHIHVFSNFDFFLNQDNYCEKMQKRENRKKVAKCIIGQQYVI